MEHLVEEDKASMPFALQNTPLTQAGVHQQSQGKRDITFPGKVADGLRTSIFLQNKVVFRQVVDDLSVLIPDRGGNVDYLYLD
jgi:hypothetical protein